MYTFTSGVINLCARTLINNVYWMISYHQCAGLPSQLPIQFCSVWYVIMVTHRINNTVVSSMWITMHGQTVPCRLVEEHVFSQPNCYLIKSKYGCLFLLTQVANNCCTFPSLPHTRPPQCSWLFLRCRLQPHPSSEQHHRTTGGSLRKLAVCCFQ